MRLIHTLWGVLLFVTCSAAAATWSETEIHLQRGQLNQPYAINTNTTIDTTVVTLQHASGWEYGSNFFFIDYARTKDEDTLYGEWYPFFSSQQLFDAHYSGVVSDIGLVMGVNAGPDVEVLKYLPGLQINWNVPGFSFFNTLVTAYIDDSRGIEGGGAPKEANSMMVDVAWRYPLALYEQQFYIEGHAEYIASRTTEIPGVEVKDWLLTQVQLRWDAANLLGAPKETLFIGMEYQYWNNKLGTNEDESAVQLLAVWRF